MQRFFLIRRIDRKVLQKVQLIMRLSFVLLFIGSFCLLANPGYSQNARVNLQMEGASLTEVFREIEKQSDYRFFYNNEVVNIDKSFSVNADNEPVSDLLADLFKGTDIDYRMVEKYIVITQKNDNTFGALAHVAAKQGITVTGTVTDKNEPIPGVNVVVKGTSVGVVTDVSGKYVITVPSKDAILTYSFIGYATQETLVGDQTRIDVALNESTLDIEEVVVVGYGVQKKVNLTGSITTVKMDDLNTISTPSVTHAIMGRTPGMFIKNVNGQPGDNKGIQYNIRGFGAPLIIVDDMPMSTEDFNRIDPSDIESFNVMKDGASAAVYGARAGNGVILVKTKRGNISKPAFSYNGNVSFQFFTKTPHFVSSAEYAEMENVANFNEGKAPVWTKDQIKAFRDGSDPNHYPDTDWWDLTIKDYAAQTQQNLSVSGGTDRVKYFVSSGYFHQDGMLRSDDIKLNKYNLRSNIDINLAKNLNFGVDMSFVSQDYIGPRNTLERRKDASGIMTALFRARPYAHNKYKDPAVLSDAGEYSPVVYSEIDNVGYIKWNNMFGDVKMNLSYTLPFGFKVKALFDFDRKYYRYKEKTEKKPVYTYNWDTDVYTFKSYTNSDNKLYEKQDITKNFNQQYYLTWNKNFGLHNFGALFLFEKLSYDKDWFDASRMRYDIDIDYLFAGPDLDKTNDGKASQDGRESFIGRINYDYAGKYLAEFSGRYDGSPRFPADTRWGFFPSASLGWRLSEEHFIKDNVSFIDNLKVRASYGQLGYDKVGEYKYLATYYIVSKDQPYIYDEKAGVVQKSIRTDSIPNPNITWEKMKISNIGIDFNLWKNKIEGSFDYFYRKRTDVLESRTKSLPDVVGAPMPKENYAEYDNRGWEAALTYHDRVGEWNFSVGGNVSWNREKILYTDQNVFASDEARRRDNKVGEWSDRFWAVRTDGFFSSMEEIRGWADQDGKNNATILPGDIRKIDYNGDGKITDEDKVIVGRGTYPRLSYGVTMSVSWKGFDFSMLWQGAALYDFNLKDAPDLAQPFYASDSPQKEWYKNAYVPEGQEWMTPNTSGFKWPRYRTDTPNRSHSNFAASDFWLINGSYIRLKNIELGYTLPVRWTQQVGIEKCKVYVSGYNVLTFFPLDYLDPEADTKPANTFGSYYPPVGTYTFGLLLQF